MANLINKWREYEAGILTPPAIIQHDYDGVEHLVWVWTGTRIVGPISRTIYDENAIIETAITSEQTPQIEDESWQQ